MPYTLWDRENTDHLDEMSDRMLTQHAGTQIYHNKGHSSLQTFFLPTTSYLTDARELDADGSTPKPTSRQTQ